MPKMSIWGQIVSEIVAQLYSENSIQTLLIFSFLGRPKKNLVSYRILGRENTGNEVILVVEENNRNVVAVVVVEEKQ